MLNDRYGNTLSTGSHKVQDAYSKGLDLYLGAEWGVEDAFNEALAVDNEFALAHLVIARNRQVNGDAKGAREALGKARALAVGLSAQEAGQMTVLGYLIEGNSAAAYKAARVHLTDFPRDALIAQTCLGVFGLIGFSGQPGREAENLALAEILAPHYGDDWWFKCLLAFAQVEAGQLGPAEKSIETSLAGNPRNANAAHYRAHIYYEFGETDAGLEYLEDWLTGYDKRALMHCHLSWHTALWKLGKGDIDAMWDIVDRDVTPGNSWGPPLNVLADTAAILYRAEMAGVEVSKDRWKQVSDYAAQYFPRTGLNFADVHAALSHAMVGESEALKAVMTDTQGPAADMVVILAEAFQAIAKSEWHEASVHLTHAMADHAKIGGSKAQRDLIEYAMVSVLLKLGQADEARRLLLMRRPATDTRGVVAGL